MSYVTPRRFRNMGLGSDLSTVPNTQLASVLDRASNMVDAYCAVPNLPQKHSFRGGATVGESHAWRPSQSALGWMGDQLTWRSGQVRVYPWHTPLKSVNQFRIYATNNVFIEIQPTDIFVEPSGGFMEVVALSLTPVGFWAATNMLSLSNPVVKLNYNYGYSFQAVNEVLDLDLTASASGEYVAQNQFWDQTVVPEVFVNGSATTSGYTIDYDEGVVAFAPPPVTTATVKVNYTYVLPSGVAQATGVTASTLLSERALVAAGMGVLNELRVEEITLSRANRRMPVGLKTDLPDDAKVLLAPFRFVSVM